MTVTTTNTFDLLDFLRVFDVLVKDVNNARRERDELRTALEWMNGDDAGVSASAIVWTHLGQPLHEGYCAPTDYADRGRCVRTIRLMPWILPALEKLEAQSEQWREQGKLIRAELYGEAKS